MTDYQPEEQNQKIKLFSDVINNTLISKYNISRLYVYPELNQNAKIFDLIDSEMDIVYLEKMFNLEHNVCLYSKFHNIGIFCPIVQLRQLSFIKNATNESNGFESCEKVKNCCFIDITEFCHNISICDLINILLSNITKFKYYFSDFNKDKYKAEKEFLTALGYIEEE
jgi:hypothetical protein